MVSDTIIAVIMCILPSHPVESENGFEQQFHEADSAFEAKYQLNKKNSQRTGKGRKGSSSKCRP